MESRENSVRIFAPSDHVAFAIIFLAGIIQQFHDHVFNSGQALKHHWQTVASGSTIMKVYAMKQFVYNA